jgi:hypothetical protein
MLTVAMGIANIISARCYCDNISNDIAGVSNAHCYCASLVDYYLTLQSWD